MGVTPWRFKSSPRHHFERPSQTTKKPRKTLFLQCFFVFAISFRCLSLSPNSPFVERRMVLFQQKHALLTGYNAYNNTINLYASPATSERGQLVHCQMYLPLFMRRLWSAFSARSDFLYPIVCGVNGRYSPQLAAVKRVTPHQKRLHIKSRCHSLPLSSV